MELSSLAINPGATEEVDVVLQIVDVAGDVHELPATIRPRGLTPATRAGLLKVMGTARTIEASGQTEVDSSVLDLVFEVQRLRAQSVLEQVAAWDLTAGGDPVPLTIEALTDLPEEYLELILTAISAAAVEVPKAKPKPSAKRTRTAAKPHRK